MRGIVWIVVFGLVAGAEAKTISITIGQKAELRGDNLVVKVSVGNTGDESAKSVAANVRFADKTVRGKLHDDLAPNATFEEELTIATGTLGEGRWPYSIAVDYADANLYPFQALLVTTIVVGNPALAMLSVPEITSKGIAESGPLSIKFKNLAASERARPRPLWLIYNNPEHGDLVEHSGLFGKATEVVRGRSRFLVYRS